MKGNATTVELCRRENDNLHPTIQAGLAQPTKVLLAAVLLAAAATISTKQLMLVFYRESLVFGVAQQNNCGLSTKQVMPPLALLVLLLQLQIQVLDHGSLQYMHASHQVSHLHWSHRRTAVICTAGIP
jgi:hypothetical protein